MTNPLQPDLLLQCVGSHLKNRKGEIIGEIIEVTRDNKNGALEYIIIKSDVFFGRGERIFAVPASPDFINVANAGNIVLKLHKDDLQFAKGIAADKCPKPNLEFGKSVYELYRYQERTGKNSSAA